MPGVLVKRFELPGGILLAAAQKHADCEKFSVQCRQQIAGAVAYTVIEGEVKQYPLPYHFKQGNVTFSLPEEPISLIMLSNNI